MSEFVEVKTAELVGPALDWAVAMAEGWAPDRPQDGQIKSEYRRLVVGRCPVWGNPHNFYSPSTEWAHGGPLLDKYDIALNGGKTESVKGRGIFATLSGVAEGEPNACAFGTTRLIALCRAIVAAKLGGVVQVPAELVGVADELVMLPGWEQSEGAYIEFCMAKKSGKTIRELGGRVLHQGDSNE